MNSNQQYRPSLLPLSHYQLSMQADIGEENKEDEWKYRQNVHNFTNLTDFFLHN